jgi:hypothetical protein
LHQRHADDIGRQGRGECCDTAEVRDETLGAGQGGVQPDELGDGQLDVAAGVNQFRIGTGGRRAQRPDAIDGPIEDRTDVLRSDRRRDPLTHLSTDRPSHTHRGRLANGRERNLDP